MQARAKAAKEQHLREAVAASAASTPSTAGVTDSRPAVEASEPDEDNYKTLPCSNKMRQQQQQPSEGSVAA